MSKPYEEMDLDELWDVLRPRLAIAALTNRLAAMLNEYPEDAQLMAIATTLANWIASHRIPDNPHAESKQWARLWKDATELVRQMVPQLAELADSLKEPLQ